MGAYRERMQAFTPLGTRVRRLCPGLKVWESGNGKSTKFPTPGESWEEFSCLTDAAAEQLTDAERSGNNLKAELVLPESQDKILVMTACMCRVRSTTERGPRVVWTTSYVQGYLAHTKQRPTRTLQ